MDNFEIKNEIMDNEVDPAAEFLAREQNALAGLALDGDSDFHQNENDTNEPFESFEMINKIVDQNENLNSNIVREEPEKIRIWREEQKKILEIKDQKEEKKKEELREQAAKELLEWYKQHEESICKTKAANRNAEKQCVAEKDEIEPGMEWERISKLCDFNPKANKCNKDVSRMRSIILQLKQNPQIVNRNTA